MKILRLLAILWLLMTPAVAGPRHAIQAANTFSDPLLSQRNVLNMNGPTGSFEYAFINHVLSASGALGPTSSAFSATTPQWAALLDQDGYPNNSTASGNNFGGGIGIPDSANFAGPYVVTWDGDGRLTLTSQTWTETNNTGTTYTRNSNGNWTNVAGKTAYILTNVTTVGGPKLVSFTVQSTGGAPITISSITWSGGIATVTTASPHGRTIGDSLKLTMAGVTPSAYNGTIKSTITGTSTFTFPLTANPGAGSGGTMTAFLSNIRIYRQADETDLLAGKIFRTPWKQNIVTLNPSAIRFLNWLGSGNGNDDRNNRFENRNLPSTASYGSSENYTVSPVYPDADGATTPNAWTIATATPTTSNPKITPGAMVHGEIVTARIGAGGSMVRAGSQRQITPTGSSGIANGVNPNVHAVAHGFATGDKVVLTISGMPNLNRFPVTITVVDVDNFTLNGVDTTAMGTFVSGYALEYVTLNVAGRGVYPLVWTDGYTPGSQGGTSIAAGGYYTFYFDKTVAAITNGSGVQVPGVWMFNPAGTNTQPVGHSGDVPLEICTALVNEVNTLSRSQGINNVIHMWMNLPAWGMDSNDPDYSAASNWPINASNVVINGGTIGGSVYAGLDPRASLLLEYSNETWNFGTKSQAYVTQRGFTRWPASGTSNTIDMTILRSVSAIRDVKPATSSTSRVRYVLGGQGFIGMGTSQINYLRINGSSSSGQGGNYYTTDTLVTSGSWGAPISNHDAFAVASYFDPITSYQNTTTGTGTFIDDSAMFNGQDNSSNGGGNYTGAANPTQAITNFVAQVASGSGQTIGQYTGTLMPAYGSAPTLTGKLVIGYEGGADWAPSQGLRLSFSAGPTLDTNQAAFALGVYNSSQWGMASVGYFNTVAGIAGTSMPAWYLQVGTTAGGGLNGQRWSYAAPDTYASGVEGQALLNNPAWLAAGVRNRALLQ